MVPTNKVWPLGVNPPFAEPYGREHTLYIGRRTEGRMIGLRLLGTTLNNFNPEGQISAPGVK
jgi:hypothetical protein